MSNIDTCIRYGKTLEFHPGKHKYFFDGKELPSATTCLNILNKPALVWWSANCVVDHVRENLKPGQSLDELEYEQLLGEKGTAKHAHHEKKKFAATLGTLTHEWIEAYIKQTLKHDKLPDTPINEQLQLTTGAFLEWCAERDVQFLEAEMRICSRRHEYAGTADLLAHVDGELALVDFKTTKGGNAYPEFRLQLAAYLQAIQEETGRRITCRYVLGLDKETGELHVHPYPKHQVKDFAAFKAALRLYHWQQAAKNGR